MAKRHIIISGTGRSGTTFIMQVLTHLGLDTGFVHPPAEILAHCNAGLERDIRRADSPHVIKSPWLCSQIDQLLDSGEVEVEHAIVPVRDLLSAAESRRAVSAKWGDSPHGEHVPGGVWLTDDGSRQESVLAEQFYQLMFALTKHGVPTTMLLFPRLVNQSDYLYRGLRPILGGISYDRFLEAFQSVVRPELVHDFRQD